MAYNDKQQKLGKALNPNAESYQFGESSFPQLNTGKSVLSAESAEYEPRSTIKSDFPNTAFSYNIPSSNNQSLSFLPNEGINAINQQQPQTLFDAHLNQQQILIDAQLQSQMQQRQQQIEMNSMINNPLNMTLTNMFTNNSIDTIPINQNLTNIIPSFQKQTINTSQLPQISRSLSLEMQLQKNEKMQRPKYESSRTTIKDILHHNALSKSRKASPTTKIKNAFKDKKYSNCRNEEFDIDIITESEMDKERLRLIHLNETIQQQMRKDSKICSLQKLSKGLVPTIPSPHTMSISKPPKLTKKIADSKPKSITPSEAKENDLSSSKSTDQSEKQIVNIWASNLNEAMSKIEDIIEKYPYIALVCYVVYIIFCARINLNYQISDICYIGH